MPAAYKIGDLVHIPQAVRLVACDASREQDPQLIIPLAVHETEKPEIAVIVDASEYGYVRVFWSGKAWSVRDDRVFGLKGKQND